MKFRDLYLDEVYKNIDQYKIEALKKISMERFDEVQVGCDPEITGKKRKREKLFKLHSNMLKYYQMVKIQRLIHRNLLLVRGFIQIQRGTMLSGPMTSQAKYPLTTHNN